MPAAASAGGISGTNVQVQAYDAPTGIFVGLHARRFGTLLSHQQPACGTYKVVASANGPGPTFP